MRNPNFIHFPVSQSSFSKIKNRPYDDVVILYATIKNIYDIRNFSQVSLVHPYIQVESIIFIHFFCQLMKKERFETSENLYHFLRKQLAVLFLMESIFAEEHPINDQNLEKLKETFRNLMKIPVQEILSDTLKNIFPDTDFTKTLENFFSIFNDDLEKSIFNVDTIRNWNKDEFPSDYQPWIKQIATTLSNMTIHANKDYIETLFEDLYPQRSCWNPNPLSWLQEKRITKEEFFNSMSTKNANNANIENEHDIEMSPLLEPKTHHHSHSHSHS